MASAVYSKVLWDAEGSGDILYGPSVPAGYAWIVKDVMFSYQLLAEAVVPISGAFAISGLSLTPICGGGLLSLWAGIAYHWHGSQVFEYGDTLVAQYSSGWSFRVSGFQLTLP